MTGPGERRIRVRATTRGGVTVIALDGALDSETAPPAQQTVGALMPAGARVVLDLSRTSYLSSAGLRVLLVLYRQARGSGGRLALAGVPAEVRAVMSATGFLDALPVADTVEDGVAALAG